jgi:two-component system, sensor histidine kinase
VGRRLHGADDVDLVQQLQQATAAMDHLFQGILDISKLDAGVVPVQRQPLPLEAVLTRVRSQVAPVAQARGVALRMRACRMTIDSDPVLLERILLNLVANAVRYTIAGGVLVGCRRRGEWVRIEVWDTGIGIALTDQRRVFEEFVQVGNVARDREQGLGLGLSVVRRLADLLGHRVGVASALGRGSCFSVEVPAASESTSSLEGKAAGAPADSSALVGAFVVCIDDDAMVRGAMNALFADWGVHFVTAADVTGAIEGLQHHLRAPDAIVCDYRLRDGTTALSAIAAVRDAVGQRVPALVITGDVAAFDLRAVREAGLPLLHKPVNAERLATALVTQIRASADAVGSPR